MDNYNQPPQYNFQYQQVTTSPLPPPSEHTHLHHNRQQEKPIFLFENDEFFTESEWYGKVIAAASSTYKHCYRLFFAGFIMICFLCVPFIGMGAGMLDAFITLFARPFARPVGKVMADVMGYTYYRSKDAFPRVVGEKNV